MKKVFATLVLAAAIVGSAHGQAISQNGGSIQGTITDPSGAAVPGASIVISSPETGYSHTLKSDSAGFYSLGPLIPGSYNIAVTAGGFQRLSVSTVVRTGTVTSGSEKLSLGNTSETVEVNAGAIQVNTDQIGVAGVITKEQIDSLPINGRNILDVAQLEPGVILQEGESFDPTKAGYSAVSVGGVSGRTTRILLDGQDITDETVGTTLFNTPLGAVDEFQINRSTQDVSGEVTSTGQVLVSTRSGTNAFHGNAFYNFQDNRAGFAQVNGLDAPFQRNQFGGYVGGPLLKDKLFFFGGAERIKQQQQNVAQSPDPVFNGITSAYPFVPFPFRDNYSTGRLDYHAPHGINMFVRGTYSVNSDDATFGLNPYSIYNTRNNVYAIVGGVDFTTGKFTHSFRVGYEKFHNILGDGTAALGSSIYDPSNQVSIVGSFYAGPNYLAPQGTFQSDKQFRYDGTWTHGANTVRFGGEMNRILNGGFAEFFGASLYSYLYETPGLAVADCGGIRGAGQCLGDPYNGYVAYEYVLGNGNSFFSERPGFGLQGGGNPSWRFAGYVADSWKVRPSLTLTAGLRWSTDTDRANQDLPTPLCSSVDPALQFPGCTGNTPLFDQYGPGMGLGKQTHQPYGNFGPQAGFVFSPGAHKFSLRGGAGIYYESDIFNNTGNSRTESIQVPGQFQNQGVIVLGQTSITLPGYGTVSSINGVPISTIMSEPISQAAPQFNQLKAMYQAKVAGSASSNPSYIGTGDGLKANDIYAGPYLTPYSIQINGGVQYEVKKGIIVSADYVHNATLKVPLTIDTNHVGAARYLNVTAAQNAITATTTAFGCAGGYSATAINCAINAGAQITDFAGNGLDSGNVVLSGFAPAYVGVTPNTGAAFPGANPYVGNGLFILPIGKSGYDALQLVVRGQQARPAPGIVSSNYQVSYSLSRVISNVSSADQFFEGNTATDYDNPDSFLGRSGLDHTNQVTFGGSVDIKYGLQIGLTGHFFSAPPSTLTLDTGTGAAGQIFQTDLTGDGTTGDPLPGTTIGTYMHAVKPKNVNQLISNYNAQYAGRLTPAGSALVNAGLFSSGQLSALNAVQQPIAPAPAVALPNSAFRTFDASVSYPITFKRFHEGLSLVPGVNFYNVTNMSNFGGFSGTLFNVADAGGSGHVNSANSQAQLNSVRVQRGSGTFDAGAPRSTEFQLKLNF